MLLLFLWINYSLITFYPISNKVWLKITQDEMFIFEEYNYRPLEKIADMYLKKTENVVKITKEINNFFIVNLVKVD